MKYMYDRNYHTQPSLYDAMMNMLSHNFVWNKNELINGWITGKREHNRHYICHDCGTTFHINVEEAVRLMRSGAKLNGFVENDIYSCSAEKAERDMWKRGPVEHVNPPAIPVFAAEDFAVFTGTTFTGTTKISASGVLYHPTLPGKPRK